MQDAPNELNTHKCADSMCFCRMDSAVDSIPEESTGEVSNTDAEDSLNVSRVDSVNLGASFGSGTGSMDRRRAEYARLACISVTPPESDAAATENVTLRDRSGRSALQSPHPHPHQQLHSPNARLIDPSRHSSYRAMIEQQLRKSRHDRHVSRIISNIETRAHSSQLEYQQQQNSHLQARFKTYRHAPTASDPGAFALWSRVSGGATLPLQPFKNSTFSTVYHQFDSDGAKQSDGVVNSNQNDLANELELCRKGADLKSVRSVFETAVANAGDAPPPRPKVATRAARDSSATRLSFNAAPRRAVSMQNVGPGAELSLASNSEAPELFSSSQNGVTDELALIRQRAVAKQNISKFVDPDANEDPRDLSASSRREELPTSGLARQMAARFQPSNENNGAGADIDGIYV